MTNKMPYSFFLVLFLVSPILAAVAITDIEPTIFSPRQPNDQELRQLYRIHVANDSGQEMTVKIRFFVAGQTVVEEDKTVKINTDNIEIAIPEISSPTDAKCEIWDAAGELLDSKQIPVVPQKKWKIFCAAVSHQDLGFIDYYQRVRRHVRENGIEKALECCRLTDDWPEDSRFRWTVETSEPILRFINMYPPATVAELVRRIREGRIELGGLHNTISTEMAGYEVLARSFYNTNRYIVDKLGIEPAKVVLINDVVGLTRSLPLYLKEAQIPYFMHGSNNPHCLAEVLKEPVFYWTSPDNDKNAVLCRTDFYYSPNRIKVWTEEEIQQIVDRQVENSWKADCLLAFDSEDFSVPSLSNSENIRNWNQKWAYPRIINATFRMYFDDIKNQLQPSEINIYNKDAPDAWADQDSTDAALLAKARYVTEKIPAAEKFSTFAMTLSGGYPEKEIWQAYNRLIMYHEHTNGAADGGRPDYYETEKDMHRALVEEAESFCEGALNGAIEKISGPVKTDGDCLMVYNSLNWTRSDSVLMDSLESDTWLIDTVTGKKIKPQRLVNGKYVFIAENVPSLGYQTFTIMNEKTIPSESQLTQNRISENGFYRVTIDPEQNIITSIFDKSLNQELLDGSGPYHLGEYLYYDHDHHDMNRANFTDISLYHGDIVDEIHLTQDTPDTAYARLVIYVYHPLKRIDFDLQVDKLSNGTKLTTYVPLQRPAKEAAFCALPLRVPEFQIHHELSGAVVEPTVNQFAGSETAFYAIQHWTDVSNPNYGITLCPQDCPIVEYGYPRLANWDSITDHESVLQKPEKSHLFLYLMNNMFYTNVCIDQPGPKQFRWSLRSHEGEWRKGKAYTFGWDTSNPMFAFRVDTHSGRISSPSHSFVEVDADHVVCSTVKPAESNGKGFILRFYELAGVDTTVNVKVCFLDKIDSAVATSLIENDLSPLPMNSDSSFSFDMKGHGLQTVRITAKSEAMPVEEVTAKAVSDMQVDLAWAAPMNKQISHYAIYRGLRAGFKADSLSFVGTSQDTTFTDVPELSIGGWPSNVLEPDTLYYYRVAAVDKYNNKGRPSDVVACRTLKTSQSNQKPLQVKGLHAVYVTPNGPENYINLWFYTNCEPDVTKYEIYRGLTADFVPEQSNRIGGIDVEKETEKFCNTFEYPKKQLDRQMFSDKTAERIRFITIKFVRWIKPVFEVISRNRRRLKCPCRHRL